MASRLLPSIDTSMAPLAFRRLGSFMVVATLLHFWGRNLADPDLWGHLTWGRLMIRDRALPRTDTFSYTAAGRPFFDHEWLADVLMAGAFDAMGSWGLIALKLGLGAIMLACILDAARTLAAGTGGGRPVHPLTVAVGTILALAVIAPGATFRPQLFTMAFMAGVLALLGRADARLARRGARAAVSWELWILPPLLALWANLHGGFLVGIGLVGLHATAVVWRRLRRRPEAPAARDAACAGAIALLAAAAPLLNPYGIELYRYLAATLHLHDGISEWAPVTVLDGSFLRFKAMVAATAILSAWWWQTERAPAARSRLAWQLAFVALAAAWALRHQRHTVLFAIAAAPVLIVAAERARIRLVGSWPALVPRRPVMRAIAAGMMALACLQVAGVAAAFGRGGGKIRYSRLAYPIDALAFIEQHDLRGNIALPMQWGSYTVSRLGDRLRVFIDGRFEAVYPRQAIDDYFAFMQGRPGWERLLDAYPTEIVLLGRAHGVHPRMFARDDFVYVYSDRAALVFVRRGGPNDAALDRLMRMARRPAPPALEPVFP